MPVYAPYTFDLTVSPSENPLPARRKSDDVTAGDLQALIRALDTDFPRELRRLIAAHVLGGPISDAGDILVTDSVDIAMDRALSRLVFQTMDVDRGGAALMVRIVSLDAVIDLFGPDIAVFDAVVATYGPLAYDKALRKAGYNWVIGRIDYNVCLSKGVRSGFAEAMQSTYGATEKGDIRPAAFEDTELVAFRSGLDAEAEPQQERRRGAVTPQLLAAMVSAAFAMVAMFSVPGMDKEDIVTEQPQVERVNVIDSAAVVRPQFEKVVAADIVEPVQAPGAGRGNSVVNFIRSITKDDDTSDKGATAISFL
ncbi:MAG: hypothetical protein AAGC95_05835 [Pseudomonadota bacterium]